MVDIWANFSFLLGVLIREGRRPEPWSRNSLDGGYMMSCYFIQVLASTRKRAEFELVL